MIAFMGAACLVTAAFVALMNLFAWTPTLQWRLLALASLGLAGLSVPAVARRRVARHSDLAASERDTELGDSIVRHGVVLASAPLIMLGMGVVLLAAVIAVNCFLIVVTRLALT